MKLLILKNKIINQDVFNKGLELFKKNCADLAFPVEIKIREINKVLTSESFTNSTVHAGVSIKPEHILSEVDGDYDIACLIYNWDGISPRPTNPTQSQITKNGCTPIQIPEQWYGIYPEVFDEFLRHEVCHAMYYLAGKVSLDNTHGFYTSPFSQTPGGTNLFYNSIITSMLPFKNIFKGSAPVPPPVVVPPPGKPYKHFSQAEVDKWKMVPALWKILDEMRELAGLPFIITSGLRTKEENDATAGSVGNSAHLRGLAVDLQCSENIKRTMMLRGIYASKTAVFVEIAQRHIHIDIDKSIHVMGDTIVSKDD